MTTPQNDQNPFPDWHDPSLEKKLEHAFAELSLAKEEKAKITSLLAPLRNTHEFTNYHYQHSVRVGLLCYDIADFMHLDKKILLYCGIMHDIGKSCVPLELLAKADVRLSENTVWTPEDHEAMKAHVTKSYELTKDAVIKDVGLLWIPDIVVRHHRYGADPYPKELPAFPAEYSEGTKAVVGFYSRLVALADVYDALHRLDQKQRSEEEIREYMFRQHPEVEGLVEKLYKEGIFK